jgi:uncharacterized protein
MRFVVYSDTRAEWRWRLKALNGRTIADSGEGYKSKRDCLEAIKLVQSSYNAPVLDV